MQRNKFEDTQKAFGPAAGSIQSGPLRRTTGMDL
jgi:hypothetical protein